MTREQVIENCRKTRKSLNHMHIFHFQQIFQQKNTSVLKEMGTNQMDNQNDEYNQQMLQ